MIVFQSLDEEQEGEVLQGHVPFTEMMWFKGLASFGRAEINCILCTDSPSYL